MVVHVDCCTLQTMLILTVAMRIIIFTRIPHTHLDKIHEPKVLLSSLNLMQMLGHEEFDTISLEMSQLLANLWAKLAKSI